MFAKIVIDKYIVALTTGGGMPITESEYDEILTTIRNKPTAREGYNYRLKTDLTWEEYEVTSVDPEPMTDEEALTRYSNTITGKNDQTLIEATETLIKEKIKED